MTIIIYHANCADGFTAAWLCEKHCIGNPYLLPMSYGDIPPDVKDHDVMIVDFSFPRKVLLELEKDAKSIVVLDHHESAQKELKGLKFCRFDTKKCGARLVQEYFNLPSSWLIDYVEDRDLWKWKLPYSREINSVIASTRMVLDCWDKLNNSRLEAICMDGVAIRKYQEVLIEKAIWHSEPDLLFKPHHVLSTHSTVLMSEICERLLDMHPNISFAAVWWMTSKGKQYSLRSRDKVNVATVAEKFGGGGHPKASGFILKGI